MLLWLPEVAGEPGEEVALEFRVSSTRAIDVAVIRFTELDAAADFLGASAEGTAAAHFETRGVGYNPHSVNGGSEVFLRGNTRQPNDDVPPGENLVLIKALLRVRPEAVPGSYPIKVLATDFSSDDRGAFASLRVSVNGDSRLTVSSPNRPRPLGALACAQERAEVALTWRNTEAYDSIEVTRNGFTLAALAGDSTSFRDTPSLGPTKYSLTARRGAAFSRTSSCEILVQAPRPEAVGQLICAQNQAGISLTWTNAAPYEVVRVLRNDRLIAELPGTATSHVDPWTSSLFTVYTLRGVLGGIEAPPVSCRVNELSGKYVVWAEDVNAEPGDRSVPLRIYCTNPDELQNAQIAFRIDPALARIRSLTLEGTASERAVYDQFLYQRHVLDRGETACGILFDSVPPYGILFPAGADQHLLTVLVDIPSETPPGTRVALAFNGAGSPALDNHLTVKGTNGVAPESHNGSILVGASPVPPVGGIVASLGDGAGGEGGGGGNPGGVTLRWLNRETYSEIVVERDGTEVVRLPGRSTSFLDDTPGPGVHRYRVFALAGGVVSFPAIVTSRPVGIPGTFLRGDATRDGALNIADAAFLVLYLFQGGREPSCLDAADADDNGRVNLTDAVSVLGYLFLGASQLPEPGTVEAWFDPSADELGCN